MGSQCTMHASHSQQTRLFLSCVIRGSLAVNKSSLLLILLLPGNWLLTLHTLDDKGIAGVIDCGDSALLGLSKTHNLRRHVVLLHLDHLRLVLQHDGTPRHRIILKRANNWALTLMHCTLLGWDLFERILINQRSHCSFYVRVLHRDLLLSRIPCAVFYRKFKLLGHLRLKLLYGGNLITIEVVEFAIWRAV